VALDSRAEAYSIESYGYVNNMKNQTFVIRKDAGMALVLVLAVLVLMLGITLAFFSQAMLDRSISGTSAANAQAELLARSASELVIGDILQEVAAGSALDTMANVSKSVFAPLSVSTANQFLGTNIFLSAAPSMLLQRVVATNGTAPASLAKQSVSGRPFFQVLSGYTNHVGGGTAPSRASAVGTGERPLRGREVSTNRWLMPRLVATNEILTSPNWIYLNRLGESPVTFSPAMTTNAASNGSFVIGRFAYNLYDVGGLIDINVVGNALAAGQNARRGRLHQVSLTAGPAPLTIPDFNAFVSWRSGASASDNSTNGGLADPTRAFITVPSGAQAFVSRQDLLRYVAKVGMIPDAALPFLTTFSRDLAAPAYSPEPNRPLLPALPNPGDMNPSLASVRFGNQTTLSRGADADVTVPSGTSVMARRFPLTKLSLLGESTPDAASLSYYFGLTKTGDGVYEYSATSADGRIKRLTEVTAEGREPNLFEVLQAVIVTGSLGRNAGNTLTLDDPRDSLRNLQVIQIGANLIDQWDADDIPTTLRSPSGWPGEFLDCHGIENLPLINNIALIAHRPTFNRDLFQVWAVFDVWNPHQNATSPPPGLEFRIQPRSGRCRASIQYRITSSPSNSARDVLLSPLSTANSPSSVLQDIVVLNAGRQLTFASADFSSPAIVSGGAPPTAVGSSPGLLLNDFLGQSVPPAIPAKATRSAALQQSLNALMDFDFPYTATPSAFTTENATGNRLYAAGTTFSGLNATAWNSSTNASGQQVLYANYGLKAHNLFRVWGDVPGSKVIVDLQVRRSGGDWRTIQTVEQFLPRSSDPGGISLRGSADATSTVTQDPESAPADYQLATHYSVLPSGSPLLNSRFYGWRQPRSQISLVKFDPRTIRFGHSGHGGLLSLDLLGTTIRQTTDLPPSPWPSSNDGIENLGSNWRVLRDTAITGTQSGVSTGFEWMGPGSNPATYRIPFGLVANIPEGSLNTRSNPSRYADLDGIIRPGDGYLGALPTVPSRLLDRPRILNRPFANVGEMGHVFRDLPWKTLDFSTRNSGDLGLLDAFSVEEPAGATPLVAGKVNLNSAPVEVLASLLAGTAKTEDGSQMLSATEANQIAGAIVAAREAAPFRDRGDIVARVLSPLAATNAAGPISDLRKSEREASIRTLGEIGTTRTWNFLLDLIVQTGRFSSSAQALNQFAVRAERRYWIHFAIDRFTGQVLASQWETVNE
jgi:hypothetical protein